MADKRRATGGVAGRVTHPTIIRVAIAVALRCPMECVFNIDIAPLSRATMSFNGKWQIQELSASRAAL